MPKGTEAMLSSEKIKPVALAVILNNFKIKQMQLVFHDSFVLYDSVCILSFDDVEEN